MAVRTRARTGTNVDAKNRRASLQWTALAALAVIVVLAFFVFFDSGGVQ